MHPRIRKLVILLTSFICIFYLLYRGIFTLNLSSPYAIFASIFLYVAEVYGVTVVLLFFVQVWDTREPPQQPVLPNRSVDVFVPTYNEDPDLLRTTLQACVRMDYPHRTFLCDDGGTELRCNDPEKGPPSRERAAKLKAICAEVGAIYITRPDNRHAKAGNVNYAFEQTDGEFIIIFDADHVPEPHFITRLIGYFADEKLAFVQTPHAFYNFHSFQSCHDHEREEYWEDGQLFYRVIQPGRNYWNAPIFAGSAAMFRRKALAEVGYIATETITEDMHTGLRMHCKGWKSLGVSERLIAGQAAPDVTTFHTQRLRWGEGNLSIMAHDNPLTVRGLTFGQRMCYLGSMIHWAGGIFKLAIYLTPLMMLLTSIPPVNHFSWTLFGIMVLYIFASVFGVKYVCNGQGSFWRNELFTMIGCWTQLRGTMRAVFWRKFSQFVVTSKRGRQSNSVWPFVRPHVYFVMISALALFWGWCRVLFGISEDYYKPILASCWTIFHMVLAISCIRRSLWPEDKRYSYRHIVHLPVEYSRLRDGAVVSSGMACTTDLSENGLGMTGFQALEIGSRLRVRVHGTGEILECDALVVRAQGVSRLNSGSSLTEGGYRFGLRFEELSPPQFDTLNRICMHYAVPRLYERYNRLKPMKSSNLIRKMLRLMTFRWLSTRKVPRKHYRLPLQITMDGCETIYASTEDVSREAFSTTLATRWELGQTGNFSMFTPMGVVQGRLEVIRVESRNYAAKTYNRTILGFTHFEGQGRISLEDLLSPAVERTHREALIPRKRPMPVPMLTNTAWMLAALVPFVVIVALTFREMHRDDIFLRDLVASEKPVSGADYEKLERIYTSTLLDNRPSTDRLVLLVQALGKLGRDADADQVITQLLAPQDRKNLDLQIANANAFLHSRDYGRARAEYERLFREFQEGKLPPDKRRAMQLALARSTFHSGEVDEAARIFAELLRETPEDLLLRYEYAGTLVNAKRWTEAIHVYDGITPDRPGRLLLATAYALTKQNAEADRQVEVLLRTDPNDAEAQLLKADLLHGKDNTAQAEAIYMRLRRINPGDPAVRSRLGFIALTGKHYDQALLWFQQLVEEGNATTADMKAYVDAAAGAEDLGESYRADTVLVADRAWKEWADDSAYLARLGWVLQRVKEFDRSIEFVEKASRLKPGDPALQKQLLGVLIDARQWEKALPYLEQAERTPENRTLLAMIYLDKKLYIDAEREARAKLEVLPGDVTARLQLATALGGQNRPKEARALLQELVREVPTDPILPLRLAEAMLASKDYAEAIARFQNLLEASFEQPEAAEGFINAAAGLKTLTPEQLPMARRLAQHALAGKIAKPELLSRLAWVLFENEERTLVSKLLDLALAAAPKDPALRIEIAGVLAQVARPADALKLYEGVPVSQQDPLQLIALHSALRDWPAAEKRCWAVLQREPENRLAWRWLADVLSWKGDYPRSLEWFAKLSKASPEDEGIQARIAEVTLWKGDAPQATAKFLELLEKTFEKPHLWQSYLSAVAGIKLPTPAQTAMVERIHQRIKLLDADARAAQANPLFLARLGRVLLTTKPDDAAMLLSRAMALAPEDPQSRRELATILAGAKKFAEALRLYENLTLDTEDRLRLIEICSAAEDFAQAKLRCQALLKIEPDNLRARRMLADVMSWKGEYTDALRHFQDLQRLEPDDLNLRIRIAEVLLWSGDAVRSLTAYQSLPEQAWERTTVRRGFVDAAASLMASSDGKPDPKRCIALTLSALAEGDELGTDPVYLGRLGSVLTRVGEKELAGRALERAITLNPSEERLRLELAGALQAADRYADALKFYEGITLRGDSRFRRVEVYCALKQFDKAEQECLAIVRILPKDPQAKRWLADVLSWKGDYAQSLKQFEELVRQFPQETDYQLRLAEVALWSGNPARAAKLFSALRDESLAAMSVRRSYIDALAGLPANTATTAEAPRLRRIAELSLQVGDPLRGDAVFLARLGLVLARAQEKLLSDRTLDLAIRLGVKDPAVRMELGGVLTAVGKYAEAAQQYDGLALEGENRFRKIDLLAAQRDWATAIHDCRAILETAPNDRKAKRRLAELLAWKGDYPEALRSLRDLVTQQPTDLEAKLLLAEVSLWSGDRVKAIELYQALPETMFEAVSIRKGYVDAVAGLEPAQTTKLDKARLMETAKRSLLEGDSLRNEPVYLSRLALALANAGEKLTATTVLDRADGLNPATPAAKLELAGAMITLGRFVQARKIYDGLTLEAADRFRKVDLYAAMKDWPAAVSESRRLIARDPADKDAQRKLADVLSWKGDYTEAIRLLTEMAQQDPTNLALQIRLTEVTLWSKDTVTALKLVEALPDAAYAQHEVQRTFLDAAAVSDKPLSEVSLARTRRIAQDLLSPQADERLRGKVSYLSRVAWILLKGNERETASQILALALTLDPKDPVDRKQLGGSLAAARLIPEAEKMLQGLTLVGEDRFILVGLHAAKKEYEQAETECRQYLVDRPADLRGQRWLADVLSWRGSYEESLRIFKDLLRRDPTNPELKVRIAEVTLWSKDTPAALTMFENLLMQSPDQPRLWDGFVAAAAASTLPLSETQTQWVNKVLASAEKAELKSTMFWARLGWILHRDGDTARSKPILVQALATKPTDPEERREIAGLLSGMKRYSEAATYYTDFTLTADDRIRLAELHAASQDFAAAKLEIERYLQAKPNDKRGLRYLADILSWSGDYPRSLEIFSGLLKNDPMNAELQRRMAEVRLWSKSPNEALTSFQQLLQRDPLDADLMRDFIDAAAAVKELDADQHRTAVRIAKELLTNTKFKLLQEDSVIQARLALVLHRAGEKEQRDRLVERVAKIGPATAVARRELAGIFMAIGATRQAREWYLGLELDWEDRMRVIDLNMAEKAFKVAEDQARELYREFPKEAQVRRKLAQVLTANGKHADAMPHLRELLDATPGDATLEIDLALATLWSGDTVKGLALLTPLAKRNPEVPVVMAYLDALAQTTKLDSATHKENVLALNEAQAKYKFSTEKQRQLAWVLRRVGEKEKALDILERLIKADPQADGIRLELAQTLDDLGRPAEAQKHYRLLLQSGVGKP